MVSKNVLIVAAVVVALLVVGFVMLRHSPSSATHSTLYTTIQNGYSSQSNGLRNTTQYLSGNGTNESNFVSNQTTPVNAT